MTPKKTKKPRHTAAPSRAPEDTVVHVTIDPAVGRLSHTVRGVQFVAGQVRSYDLSDPDAREFVDSVLRVARKVCGREDTPRVFLVETAAQSIARARSQEEARRSPLGSAASPIRGQVPQPKVAAATPPRARSSGFERAGAPAR